VPVRWRMQALADVARIIRHIAADNPVAAARVGRAILLASDSLALFPRRGPIGRREGTRELVALPPYLLVYRLIGVDDVMILRVWHGAQDRS
jgi:toxin ParE1/3/4